MENLCAVEVVLYRQEERRVFGDLSQVPLRHVVELAVLRELVEEGAELAGLGERGHPQNEVTRHVILGDRLERFEVLMPAREHVKPQRRAAVVGYGAYATSRSSASTSSSSSVSSAKTISRRPEATLEVKPVARSAALRARSARAGSTFGTLRGLVFAPAQRAARSAARTDSPRLTIWRTSRRRPSLSGTASTARACPSLSSPRSTSASTSSGSSSSRRRFETVGFALPTRSDRSPSESPNSSISNAYARASSTAESCSRATFSTRLRTSESRSSASRTSAGSVGTPASRAARQRRSPAISSKPPAERGRTTTGCTKPWARIESASALVASLSKRLRGWRGFG